MFMCLQNLRFLHHSLLPELTFEHIRDGIMRELYVEEGGYGVSIMTLLVKERGREAGPASFVENISGSRYLLHIG